MSPYSRYMFFFQTPLLPEMLLEADDLAFLTDSFRKKPMGLVNRESITDEDIEVFKYTFSQPGNLLPRVHSHVSDVSPFTGTCKAAINYYRALFQFQSDFSRAEISSPVLLLWGCQDRALGEELANASQKYCSDIRLRKIPNASHWVNQDVPDIVNTYMDVFLQENPVMEHNYDF